MELTKPDLDNVHPKILLFGPPKTAKTSGAATAPGPILYLNADLPNATRYIHLRSPEGHIREPRMPVFEEGKGLQTLKLMGEVTRLVEPPDTEIRTVVVDTVGELYRRMLEDQSNRALNPSLPQYGAVGTHIERFCRKMCEIEHVTFVVVLHELSQKDEGSGEFKTIGFTGSKSGSETMYQKLAGMVDIIGYTGVLEHEDGRKEYVAQLVAGKGRQGGDRFDCLVQGGEVVRSVNIAEWIDVVKAYEKELRASKVSTSKQSLSLSSALPPEATAAAKAAAR